MVTRLIKYRSQIRLSKVQKRRRLAVLAGLGLLAAFAIAGPTGLLTWQENARLLAEREAQLNELREVRAGLAHRVDLLDHQGADPDLVGELVRDLNVIHPDEVLLTLDEYGDE